ncbi:VOC family protein [Streptomyces boncukensis]|uniref:VOC family protein n=1 Tax=Streptomyces boncukensis TaxID=2711219 RepID=A0A6G4X6G2_9ACTN|nr:VOC family protein [Streptomyces boncukensis]NGO72722.1 VOC family protein [Streptomyces boncukensis]
MIKALALVTIWSTDQERTVAFCTEKLGFEIRSDVDMGARWVTVGVPGQNDLEMTIMPTDGPGFDPESAEALTTLVTKGVLGAGALHTDDCHGDYKQLKDRGVEFLQEPQERPYGTEAIFRDDNGSWWSLTQRREGELDFDKPWGEPPA